MQGDNLASAREEIGLDQAALKPEPGTKTAPAKARFFGFKQLAIERVLFNYSQL